MNSYSVAQSSDSIAEKHIAARTVYLAPYVLPSPTASDQDWLRFHNEDLPDMDDTDLWAERERVRVALACGDPKRLACVVLDMTPSGEIITGAEWLKERLRAVAGEEAARRGVRARRTAAG